MALSIVEQKQTGSAWPFTRGVGENFMETGTFDRIGEKWEQYCGSSRKGVWRMRRPEESTQYVVWPRAGSIQVREPCVDTGTQDLCKDLGFVVGLKTKTNKKRGHSNKTCKGDSCCFVQEYGEMVKAWGAG